MRRVLIVCSGNTCRSPMAEALLRRALERRGRGDIEVISAGTDAMDGLPASHEAVEVMAARGLDLSEHRSRRLTRELAEGTLALCMTDRHARIAAALGARARVMTEFAGIAGDVPDPYGLGRAAYERAADTMDKCVERIVNML